MITLYGIKNCDTVKKARKWLEQHNINYRFHDFREDGLQQSQVEDWISKLDWETVLNKRSTSFRQLSDEQKNNLNADTVAGLLTENPTLIKRPLVENGTALFVGFNDKQWQSIFAE
ncbi:ArsC family reductase [Catenovulum sp. 2E275]|uniref:ArsC family reductase n=1 Tax=Catenovulum sp. 2E275 TaxID=2980497 RepID=UPI0021CEB255|nr:ArsC family reductase [Catenovulum sp. 2E275]MCU4674547.1 ArsC family reductase [Catenovulum sp. 2E275]